MKQRSLDEKINESGNYLKTGIFDLIEHMRYLCSEIQAIKGTPVKPTKHVARAMLEYISWEDKHLIKTVTLLGGNELYRYFRWIDEYCAINKCSQEEALNMIIREATLQP